jgi:hypothetical protein
MALAQAVDFPTPDGGRFVARRGSRRIVALVLLVADGDFDRARAQDDSFDLTRDQVPVAVRRCGRDCRVGRLCRRSIPFAYVGASIAIVIVARKRCDRQRRNGAKAFR